MKLKWKSITNNKSYWITDYVTKLTWSGADTQASRTVEFEIANNPRDPDIKRLPIRSGDGIKFYDDNNKLKFIGRVTGKEKKSEVGTIQITAMDYMHNLISSKASYKFKGKTPEYITKALCHDLGIATGKIKTTKHKISKYMPSDMSYYDMIIKAYQFAAKANGHKYFLRMDGTKLNVVEKGKIIKDFRLNDAISIYNSEYSEKVDSSVNKVVLYNSHNQKIGTVKNKAQIKKFGVYQATMSVDDRHKKAVTKPSASDLKKAKAQMVGADKTASIEALGSISCISGYGVRIVDTASGLTGIYWIKSDSHVWEKGHHTMTLELEFKNQMETVTYNKYSPAKKKKSSSSGSSSGGYYYTTKRKYPAYFTAYGAYAGRYGSYTKGKKIPLGRKSVAGNHIFARKKLKLHMHQKNWNKRIVTVWDNEERAEQGRYKGKYWYFDVYCDTASEAIAFGAHLGYVDVLTKHKKKVKSWSGSGNGKLGWPCHGTITCEFGVKRSWDKYGPHSGMDIAVKTGTPIHAAAAGKVVVAARKAYQGYGRAVMIDHGNGLRTLYGHNSVVLVKVGQHVKRGQVIAKAGSTGFSSGPHCHFEVRKHGRAVNPRIFL